MRMVGVSTRSLVVTLSVALLAGGAVACGDSEDGNAGDSARSTAPSTEPATSADESSGDATGSSAPAPDRERDAAPPAPAGGDDVSTAPQVKAGGFVERPAQIADREQERVTEVVATMYEALALGDAAGVCATLAKAAREDVAKGVAVGAGGADVTCEDSFSRFLAAARQGGSLARAFKAKIGKVRVEGNEAFATVSFAGQSGQVRVVKENGRWRLGAAGVVHAPQ